jgi:formylmethanofuran dehydrogenase subunit D
MIIIEPRRYNIAEIKRRRRHFYPLYCRNPIGNSNVSEENNLAETMILVPGRTSKQGTSLNKGKLKKEYLDVTSTLEINQDDMTRLSLQDGDEVRLSNQVGETIVRCKGRKPEDLPSGMLFIAYGPSSSQLMESDTAGSGMPLSKNIEVKIEKVAA